MAVSSFAAVLIDAMILPATSIFKRSQLYGRSGMAAASGLAMGPTPEISGEPLSGGSVAPPDRADCCYVVRRCSAF
jgi:hypothetical protein